MWATLFFNDLTSFPTRFRPSKAEEQVSVGDQAYEKDPSPFISPASQRDFAVIEKKDFTCILHYVPHYML